MEKLTSIRVCAYNVLAQNLATSKYFPSAKQALKVAKRYPLLRHKFQAINADIICISEAFTDVVDILRSLEYEVRYIQRFNKTYGNAIAWRSELFEVEREATATFNDCASAIASFPIRIEGSGVSIVREDFITENIAMFMQFRLKQHADSRVCVCSTHLYWDPSKDPVKVAQAQMLHLCSADFAALCGGCPIIIGADLNSLPDSDVYHRLLATDTGVVGRPEDVQLWSVNYDSSVSGGRTDSSSLSEQFISRLRDRLNFDGGEVFGGAGASSDGCVLSFRSAYAESNRQKLIAAAEVSSSHSKSSFSFEPDTATAVVSAAAAPSASFEPDFTNWTESFKGCIDYLLHSNHPKLTLIDVLPVLEVKDMLAAQCVGIPSVNPAEPSDHVPLAATFHLKI